MAERMRPTAEPAVAGAAADLVRMSRSVGRDASLVQGGGGNTSVKTEDGQFMCVKASGVPLGEMTDRAGHRTVRVDDVLAMLADRALASLPAAEREAQALDRLAAACVDTLPGRPSVETPLHAFLGRCVVHFHPAIANGLVCARHGDEAIRNIFGSDGPPPLIIPFCKPGLPLARRTYNAARRYRREHGLMPQVIFLGNHGVFVSKATVKEAVGTTRAVERRAATAWRSASAALPGPRLRWTDIRPAERERLRAIIADAMREAWGPLLGPDTVVRHSEDTTVRRFLREHDARRLAAAGPLTPDHVVYAHGSPFWIGDPTSPHLREELRQASTKAKRRLPEPPRCALAPGLGLFTIERDERLAQMAEAITIASLRTLLVAKAFGGVRPLSPAAIRYIEEWEVERFRRSVARGR